jgi:hypothetical protein
MKGRVSSNLSEKRFLGLYSSGTAGLSSSTCFFMIHSIAASFLFYLHVLDSY